MESLHYPFQEGGKGHEIHGAGPCMNPYGGYKDALVQRLDIVTRSSGTIACYQEDPNIRLTSN